MKLSDLINQYNGVTPQEQPQEGVQPTPQPTTQPTQKPIYTSKGDGVTSDHEVKTTTKTQTLAPWTDIPHVEVPDASYDAPDVSKIHNTGMYDLIRSYQRPTYEEDMQRAKRQQTAGMISDLAGLFAKGIGLSKGQRIFPQTRSNLDSANQNVENVRQMQRQSSDAYNQQLLNASAQDYQQDKIDKRNALLNAYNLYKAGLDSKDKALDRNIDIDKINAEGKGRVITQQQTQQKIDNDKEYHRDTLKLAEKRAKDQNSNAALNRAIALKRLQIEEAKARAASGAGNGGKSKATKFKTIALKDPDGVIRTYQYDANYEGALPSAYAQMLKAYGRNPNLHSSIPDVKIGTGEGGDQNSKTLSVIRSYANQYPETTNYIKGILHIPTQQAKQPVQQPKKSVQNPTARQQQPQRPAQRPVQQPVQKPQQQTAQPTIKKGWKKDLNKWK